MEAGRWSRGCGSGIGLSGHKYSYLCVPAAAGLPSPPARPAPPRPRARPRRARLEACTRAVACGEGGVAGAPPGWGEGGARTGQPPDDPVPPGAPVPPPCGGGGAGLTGGGGHDGWLDGWTAVGWG